jgi:filamentous hemagglutinin family protein
LSSWLATGSARFILNEVVSANPSQLLGFVEVAGSPAQVVIANPAGVTCNGCGFINASRATLTTGTLSNLATPDIRTTTYDGWAQFRDRDGDDDEELEFGPQVNLHPAPTVTSFAPRCAKIAPHHALSPTPQVLFRPRR